MKNSDSSFGSILKIMQEEGEKRNSLQCTVGTLKSIIPLEVKAYGTTLNNNQLLMSNLFSINDISIGDGLLIVPTNNNKFIVVCKVIKSFGGDE